MQTAPCGCQRGHEGLQPFILRRLLEVTMRVKPRHTCSSSTQASLSHIVKGQMQCRLGLLLSLLSIVEVSVVLSHGLPQPDGLIGHIHNGLAHLRMEVSHEWMKLDSKVEREGVNHL